MDNNIDAYAAGLFDGEGWFAINRLKCKSIKHGKFEYRYQPLAALTNRSLKAVEFLKQHYGGSIHMTVSSNPNWSDTYRWTLSGPKLTRFIENTWPYMLIKLNHAMLVLDLRLVKEKMGNQPITQEVYNYYTAKYMELKDLNKKGPHSSLP